MAASEAPSPRQVFEAALQVSGDDRESYLHLVGTEHPELEQRVRALLAAHQQSALPASDSTSDSTLAISAQRQQRERIGPYRLLERLGEGGMGVVYVAEQTQPVRRQVALKLIKGGMNTREVIGRFHSERQVLALMNHPNIARILDAGSTEDDQPYYVMEYVKGVALLEYCDRRQLSLDQRLELFIDVCMAVQHAHQKGVIHRDIKPSNLLVEELDGRATPKVIDFGVAKALHQRLTDFTVHTRLGGFIGTPDYVSPEQAEPTAHDIDTRADIYSLGAVLYELLTGLRPFDFSEMSVAEIQRTLAERHPKPPSARAREGGEDAEARAQRRRTDAEGLRRKLHGDLDWITMKALEKERSRRYSAASELAADLGRHREHETVLARPPSTTYRMGRFMRRHSLLLAVAGLALLALLAGTIGTSIGLVRAREEAERARINAAIAEEVNTFLNDDLLAAVAPDEQGIDISMREVLDTAAKRIDGRFPDQPLVEGSLRRTIGETYAALGVHAAAEQHLLRALELFQKNLGPDAEQTRDTQLRLGHLYRAEGRLDAAERALNQVLGEDAAAPPGAESELAIEALEELTFVSMRAGRFEKAEALGLRAVAAREATSGRDHPDTAGALRYLAIVYRYMERWQEAESLFVEVLSIQRKHLGPEHSRTLNALSNLAAFYIAWGRYDEAEELLVSGLEPMRRVMGREHPQTLKMANNLAWLYLKQGRYERAEEGLLESFEVKQRVLGELHPSTVEGLLNLVLLYDEMEADDRYEDYLARYVERLRRVCAGPTARTQDRIDYANLLLTAEVVGLRNPAAALAVALEAVGETGRQDVGALAVLARAYQQTGDPESAAATAREALALAAEESEVRAQMEDVLRPANDRP